MNRKLSCDASSAASPETAPANALQPRSAPAATPGLDGKLLAISTLSVTACILFVGLMLVLMRPAQAEGQSDKGGDYKMLTCRVTNNVELLVVTDSAAKKTVFYEFDVANKQLRMVSGIPLDQLPKPPAEQPDGQGANRRRP